MGVSKHIRRAGDEARRPRSWLALLAIMALVAGGLYAADAAKNIGVANASPTQCSGNTCTWGGQGATNGSVDTVECDANNTPYLLWIFTVGGGGNTVTSATLTLSGSGSGSYVGTKMGNEFHFRTPYFTPDPSTLHASVTFVGSLGNGNANLVISHGCPGTTGTTTSGTTTGGTTTGGTTTGGTTTGGTTTNNTTTNVTTTNVTTTNVTTTNVTTTAPTTTVTTTTTTTVPSPPKHHKPHRPKIPKHPHPTNTE